MAFAVMYGTEEIVASIHETMEEAEWMRETLQKMSDEREEGIEHRIKEVEAVYVLYWDETVIRIVKSRESADAWLTRNSGPESDDVFWYDVEAVFE